MTPVYKRPSLCGNRNAACLFDDEVVRIRELYASGQWSYAEIAIWYDVSRATIIRIVKRVTYADLI